MEIIVVTLFVLFMFLVDWRLNKIYKELKCLNATMAKQTPVQPIVQPHEPTANTTQKMEEYGITFDGERYVYGEYKYEKLSDAISYAKQQKK